TTAETEVKTWKDVSPYLKGFCIDTPRNTTEIKSKSFKISGWAIGKNNPVDRIQVNMGEQVICKSYLQKERPDVAKKFSLPTSKDLGFEMEIECLGIESNSILNISAVLEDKQKVELGNIHLI
ncbi:MAG: hypothetical protein AAFY76_03790, partial [Cyanobacteria bacterium J06649_11]